MVKEVTCTSEDGKPLMPWAADNPTLTTHEGCGWEDSKALIMWTSDRRKGDCHNWCALLRAQVNAAFVVSTVLLLPSSVHRSMKRSRGCASDRADLGKDNPKLSLGIPDRSHRLFA